MERMTLVKEGMNGVVLMIELGFDFIWRATGRSVRFISHDECLMKSSRVLWPHYQTKLHVDPRCTEMVLV